MSVIQDVDVGKAGLHTPSTGCQTSPDKLLYIESVLLRPDIRASEKCVAIGIILHADQNLENSHPGNRLLGTYASLRTQQAITGAIRELKDKGVIGNREPARGYARVFRVTEQMLTEAIRTVRESRAADAVVPKTPDPYGLRADGQYIADAGVPQVGRGTLPAEGTPGGKGYPVQTGVPQIGEGTPVWHMGGTPGGPGYPGQTGVPQFGIGGVPQVDRGTLSPIDGGVPQSSRGSLKQEQKPHSLESSKSSSKKVESRTPVESDNYRKAPVRENSSDRGSRLPDTWRLPRPYGQWALETFDVSAETVRATGVEFANHWISKPGKDAVKRDWFRTWQKWCGSSIQGWKRRKPIPEDDAPLLTAVIDPDVDETAAELERARQLMGGDDA